MQAIKNCVPKFQKGFTLIELLITLTVLGVITAIGVPSLRDFIVANKLSSNVNAFVGALSYARSEAIVRNQQVIVCPKSSSSNDCVADTEWGKYETLIFVDTNGLGTLASADDIIKIIPAVDVARTQFAFVKQGGAGNKISFQSGGFGNIAFRFDINAINLSDPAYETKYGRTICISKPGRARVIGLTSSPCSNS